jgi:FkbM family methyltransferase
LNPLFGYRQSASGTAFWAPSMQETPLRTFQKKPIVLDGHEFVLHGRPDDAYFNALGDNHDPEFLALCRKLIAEDAVCLDIGANIGVKTLQLARHARNGRVIAIEAGQKNAECLSLNVEENNLTNVDVVQAAIGDRTTEVKFAENCAWGYVSSEGAAVPMRTIRDVAEQFALDRIDFIKIDVEGNEFPILKSSLDLINTYGSLVLTEFCCWTLFNTTDTNPKDFIEWICANFRTVYALNRGAVGELLTPVSESRGFLARHLFSDNCVTDLLITNRADRLKSSPQWLSEQLKRAVAERDQLLAERDAAIATRDTAVAERDAACRIQDSIAWRFASPLWRLETRSERKARRALK